MELKQREIKFRIWDKKEKRMTFVENWSLDNEYTFRVLAFGLVDGQYCLVGDTEDCILMQFTGLKDKNGKEIYEGDILDYNGEVEFKNGSFVVNGWEPLGEMAADSQSIIGNIYENQELLK